MKIFSRLSILSLAFAWFAPALQAQVEPAKVMILKADSKRLIGFIQNTNDQGILLSTSAGGATTGMGHSEIVAIRFDDENDIMGPGRHAYSRGNYEEAEQLFKAVAENYDYLWGISREQLGNFASDARYFQIDCLRRLGRYAEIGAAMDTNTGKNLENTVDEVFLPELKLFELWSSYSKGDWAAIEANLAEYQGTLPAGAEEFLSMPPLQSDTPATLVQLYFLRGQVLENKEQDEDALRDYYRAVTLDFGSDKVLSGLALEAALGIQSEEEGLADNYNMQQEIHALAVAYRDVYGDGSISVKWMEYTAEPEMPESVRAAMEAAEAAAEAGEAEAAPDADAATAPDPDAAAAPAPDADAAAPDADAAEPDA